MSDLRCQVCQVSGLPILGEHAFALHALPDLHALARLVFDASSSFVIPTPNAAEESATCATETKDLTLDPFFFFTRSWLRINLNIRDTNARAQSCARAIFFAQREISYG